VLAPNVTHYSDQGLAPGTAYTYRVRTINQGGASAWSNEASATTPLPAPAAPTGLTVGANRTQLELAWTDASDNETAFAVWRKSDAGEWERIAVLPPNSTHYADTAVAPETADAYRVRSIGQGGASAWSNEASGSAGLAAPTGLMVRNGAPTLVYLEWHDPSQTESGFELYRRQGAGEWQFHALLPANETTFLGFALVTGTVYHYRVRAVGGNGPSTWSNETRWTTPP
jgi:hypothetical protein